tara:strand:- start:23 stop:499 length:477 start_codon:yes stop_codon:yes gene_type:complete
MMCAVGYQTIGYATGTGGGPRGGKPINEGKPKGSAPPPDMVNNQEVKPQTNRQALADQAQADYDAQPRDINWRERGPSRDDPQHIRFARLQSSGPMKGKAGSKEYIDDDRHMLKLNPDGTAALGMGKAYYDDLENWYSKSDLEDMGFYGSNSNDGVNL